MMPAGARAGPVDVYDTIALTANAGGGKAGGRTAIQKLIYLASQGLPALDVGEYRHNYFGPFSRKVAVAMAEMSATTFVREWPLPGPEGAIGYYLTHNGRSLAKKAQEAHAGEAAAISGLVAACRRSCGLRVMPLSYAARAHYAMDLGGRHVPTAGQVAEAGEGFDWDISARDARDGIAVLAGLGLVSRE